MWPVHCTSCRGFALLDAAAVRGIERLAPGVQVVDVECPRGHRLLLLTGPAVQPPARRRRDHAGPLSPPSTRWRAFVARQRRLWSRYVDGC